MNRVVNVTTEAALLQTDRSGTGRKIETRQLAALPLTYNRNFHGLLNLVPGAVRAFRPHSKLLSPQDLLSKCVNGHSGLSNHVQLEGVDNRCSREKPGLCDPLVASSPQRKPSPNKQATR